MAGIYCLKIEKRLMLLQLLLEYKIEGEKRKEGHVFSDTTLFGHINTSYVYSALGVSSTTASAVSTVSAAAAVFLERRVRVAFLVVLAMFSS